MESCDLPPGPGFCPCHCSSYPSDASVADRIKLQSCRSSKPLRCASCSGRVSLPLFILKIIFYIHSPCKIIPPLCICLALMLQTGLSWVLHSRAKLLRNTSPRENTFLNLTEHFLSFRVAEKNKYWFHANNSCWGRSKSARNHQWCGKKAQHLTATYFI